MKNLAFSFAALILAMLGPGASPARADIVKIGTEGAYAPYNFLNDKGEVDGFERELGDALCLHAGLVCQWITDRLDRLQTDLLGGQVDALMAGLVVTPEQQKAVGFSQDYLPPAKSVFVALNPSAKIKKGPVAVQAGSVQAAYAGGLGTRVAAVPTVGEAVDAVRNGKAAAALLAEGYAGPILADAKGALVVLGAPVAAGGGTAIALRPDDGALRQKFDAALTAMKGDGSLNAMIVKWFGAGAARY